MNGATKEIGIETSFDDELQQVAIKEEREEARKRHNTPKMLLLPSTREGGYHKPRTLSNQPKKKTIT